MEPVRLQKFLARAGVASRRASEELIASGRVSVNGEVVREMGTKIDPACAVVELDGARVTLPEEQVVLMLNKPAGYLSAMSDAHDGRCVSELVPTNRFAGLFPVDRLDKDTTGLIIVAKNDAAHLDLSQQLQRKSVSRLYYALVHGDFAHDHGTIDAPIGRDEKDRQKMAVTEKNSRDARTHFRVIERFRGFTLVECRLETGRTHQIRVHMRYIGHPVAGDEKYGYRKTLKTGGQLLHAHQLEFIHPRTKEKVVVEAPLPDDFAAVLKTLREERDAG